MEMYEEQRRRHLHRRRVCVTVCILALALLITVGSFLFLRHLHAKNLSAETVASQPYTPESVVYHYQKKGAWASDPLGDSSYTMGDSGCLTCCVVAALEMQDMMPETLETGTSAGAWNRYFSEHGAYDSEGNLQWDAVEQCTGAAVVKKDASELAEGELDTILSGGSYPIVRVRVGGIGSYHYVLVVQADDAGMYWCMDPLEPERQLVPLSDFGGKVYAVRYLIQASD